MAQDDNSSSRSQPVKIHRYQVKTAKDDQGPHRYVVAREMEKTRKVVEQEHDVSRSFPPTVYHQLKENRYGPPARRSRSVDRKAVMRFEGTSDTERQLVPHHSESRLVERTRIRDNSRSRDRSRSGSSSKAPKKKEEKHSKSKSESQKPASKGGKNDNVVPALVVIGAASFAGLKLMDRNRSRDADKAQTQHKPQPERRHRSLERSQSRDRETFRETETSQRRSNSLQRPSSSHKKELSRIDKHRHANGYESDVDSDTESDSYTVYSRSRTSLEIDEGSTSGDEMRLKKMRRKQTHMVGFATVATINAGNRIYKGIKARDARRKALAKGEITEEEARKMKAKMMAQNAASIAAAGISIRGAFNKIREVKNLKAQQEEFGKARVKFDERVRRERIGRRAEVR